MEYSEEQITRMKKVFIRSIPDRKKAEQRLRDLVNRTLAQIEDKSGDKSLVRAQVPSTRLKDWDSVLRKAKRKGLDERNFLFEIQDLVGIRIVCNNVEDVVRFDHLLMEGLQVDDIIAREDFISRAQESGYRAIHINIWIDVGEGLSSNRIPCEIQIRTLLQDSWAELTHKDIYKSELDLPADLRGRMEDLASLLACADEVAQKVRNRLAQDFRPSGPVELDAVTLEGLAFLYKQSFGIPPTDHMVREAEELCNRHGLANLLGLKEILADGPFMEKIRQVHRDKTEFGFTVVP